MSCVQFQFLLYWLTGRTESKGEKLAKLYFTPSNFSVALGDRPKAPLRVSVLLKGAATVIKRYFEKSISLSAAAIESKSKSCNLGMDPAIGPPSGASNKL